MTRDNKYGVVDSRGNIKIYLEYDEIGIDNTKFEKNNIKNKYLLDNGMIPARKDKYWGAFDKNGNVLLDFEYDGFGYTATSNKEAINLLIIPDYNLIVVNQNKKYALVNSTGSMVIRPVLDDVYMTISSGKKYYYMNANDRKINIEEFLDSQSQTTNKNNNENSNTSTNNDENNNSATNSIQNNSNTTNNIENSEKNNIESTNNINN